ncbi:hypothetical protein QQ045_002801 [Rhodiola kirilowii]
MANKLALLALLAAVLVVTDATILRTTITTTEIEEDNPYHGGGGGSSTRQQQCSSRQLQGKQFNSCKSYLQSKSSSRPYDILRVVDVNPFTEQKMMLQECCEELQDIQKELRNPQCACEALKKIIRDETQQGTSRYEGQQEIRPMLQKAKNIPEQCNLQIRSCRFEE